MFKHFRTVVRKQAFELEQSVADRNALPLVAQQIREAMWHLQTVRNAMVLAEVQMRQEKDNADRLGERIAELEAHTLCALENGREGPARETAEMIAELEDERDASRQAQFRNTDCLEELKCVVRDAEMRLGTLRRCERLAVIRYREPELEHGEDEETMASVREAEKALARLNEQQAEIDVKAGMSGEPGRENRLSTIIEKQAEAGCEAPLRTSGAKVLERLRTAKPTNP